MKRVVDISSGLGILFLGCLAAVLVLGIVGAEAIMGGDIRKKTRTN